MAPSHMYRGLAAAIAVLLMAGAWQPALAQANPWDGTYSDREHILTVSASGTSLNATASYTATGETHAKHGSEDTYGCTIKDSEATCASYAGHYWDPDKDITYNGTARMSLSGNSLSLTVHFVTATPVWKPNVAPYVSAVHAGADISVSLARTSAPPVVVTPPESADPAVPSVIELPVDHAARIENAQWDTCTAGHNGPLATLADADSGDQQAAGMPVAQIQPAPCLVAPLPTQCIIPNTDGFTLLANGDGGDPILVLDPITGNIDVHMVTVDATLVNVTAQRAKFAEALATDKRSLQDWRDQYAQAQKRVPELEHLKTLLYDSMSKTKAYQISVSATQAYKALYGQNAPIPRTLPGDRTQWLDPLRAEKPTCGMAPPSELTGRLGEDVVTGKWSKSPGGFNDSQAMTFADIERVSADINGYRQDIQKWPAIIKHTEDLIAQSEAALAAIDSWLFIHTPIPELQGP